MMKLKTLVQALDLLESETVIRDEELKNRLKKVCFSELEIIKKQIYELWAELEQQTKNWEGYQCTM